MSALLDEIRSAAERVNYWPSLGTMKRWVEGVEQLENEVRQWAELKDAIGRDLAAALGRAERVEKERDAHVRAIVSLAVSTSRLEDLIWRIELAVGKSEGISVARWLDPDDVTMHSQVLDRVQARQKVS